MTFTDPIFGTTHFSFQHDGNRLVSFLADCNWEDAGPTFRAWSERANSLGGHASMMESNGRPRLTAIVPANAYANRTALESTRAIREDEDTVEQARRLAG